MTGQQEDIKRRDARMTLRSSFPSYGCTDLQNGQKDCPVEIGLKAKLN